MTKPANLPLFPASVIGSMPRPQFVRDLLEQPVDSQSARRMDAAVSYAVALQEQAGLDIVTDGEWRRRSYIGVVAELAHGFELSTNPADGRPWTIVVDKLMPTHSGFIAREARFLRAITQCHVKVTLPSPALLGERMWDPQRSAGAYPKRESFVEDCAAVLHDELKRLRDVGADIVQIDDPHLCLFVDPEVRRQYDNPCKASDFAVDMVNRMVDGIKGLKLALHLCRRAGARARGEVQHQGGYDPILGQLNRLNVDHLTMEFTTPGAGDMSVFRQLDERFEIGLGCVSTSPGEIDSVATIVRRVEQALQHLSPQRITLNPDCGFAPGSAARVDIDEVYHKLQNQVAAAKQLREKYA